MVEVTIAGAIVALSPLAAWLYFRAKLRRLARQAKEFEKPCETALVKATKLHDSVKVILDDRT